MNDIRAATEGRSNMETVMIAASLLEMALRQHWHAEGQGLGQLATSVEQQLPGDGADRLRRLAGIRNKAAHEPIDFVLRDRERFLQDCDVALAMLMGDQTVWRGPRPALLDWLDPATYHLRRKASVGTPSGLVRLVAYSVLWLAFIPAAQITVPTMFFLAYRQILNRRLTFLMALIDVPLGGMAIVSCNNLEASAAGAVAQAEGILLLYLGISLLFGGLSARYGGYSASVTQPGAQHQP